jgi:hypothetical protein
MASTMNAAVNMETPMFGSISPIFSITSQSLQLLKTRSFAFMVDFHLQLIPWNTSDNLIEFKKYLMRDQCAICFGQIQMRKTGGVFHKEELVILSDLIFRNSSFIIIN